MAIIIIRTLIIYAALLVTLRLLGKRQLGEMELSEFVLAALVADLASNPLQDLGIPMLNGLVPILILFCCEILIAGLAMKNIRLRDTLFGRPSLLIVKGRINQRELRQNRFFVDELMQELRNQSILDISQVEYAILETDGKLNVIPYAEHLPVTPSQLGIRTDDGGYPRIIVSDGRVLEDNLRGMGRDLNWLKKELGRQGQSDVEKVFLMTLNQAGQVYFARKEEE